jgi:transposase
MGSERGVAGKRELESVKNLSPISNSMQMSRQPYPSDITRKQFERIRPLLEGARSSTRPREIDLYEVFCAVLYLLKTGCPWRALPRDFPSWQSVYAYFRIWQEVDEDGTSLLERALKKSGGRSTRSIEAQRRAQFSDRRRAEREK